MNFTCYYITKPDWCWKHKHNPDGGTKVGVLKRSHSAWRLKPARLCGSGRACLAQLTDTSRPLPRASTPDRHKPPVWGSVVGSIWQTSVLTECPTPPQKPGSLPSTPRNPLQTRKCGGPGEVPISFPSWHPLRGQQEREEAPSTRQQVGAGAGGVGTDQGPEGLGMEMAGNLSVELRGPQQAPILTAESTSYSHFIFHLWQQEWLFPPRQHSSPKW